MFGAGDKRYNNIYDSVIIEGVISADPTKIKIVNPSDLKKQRKSK